MKTLISKSMFFLTAVIMMVVVASCSLEDPLPCISDEIPEGAVIERISLEVDVPESLTPETKSSYSVEDVRRISNLNIFVYHDGRLLDGYSRYFADAKDVYMTFPPDKDGFDVYMFGNVGQVSAPAEESDIVNLQYVVDSYDDFRTEGFPVANSYMGYTKGSQTRFLVKRLVGQYSLSFENVSDIAEYTVKDLVFYNCARDIYPFGNGQAATMFFRDGDLPLPGDHLSAEDVETINAGGSVDLYFLENLQGVLLPTNTDPKNKVPDSVGESGKKCTYIRATVDIRTPAGQYTNGAYRFYCGSDATSDFNIRRNTRYTAKLNFNQDMVNEEEWRIEVDEPEVIGEFIFDKDTAMVIYGVEDMVYITPISGNHADLEYYIEYDPSSEVSSDYIQYELVDTYYYLNSEKIPCKGIHITTNYPVSGVYRLNDNLSKSGFLTARLLIKSVDSYNSGEIITTPLPIRVYYSQFPIGIVSSKADLSYVSILLNNPLKLPFRFKTLDKHYKTYYYLNSWIKKRTAKGTEVIKVDDYINSDDFLYDLNVKGIGLYSSSRNRISLENDSIPNNLTLTIEPCLGDYYMSTSCEPCYPRYIKSPVFFGKGISSLELEPSMPPFSKNAILPGPCAENDCIRAFSYLRSGLWRGCNTEHLDFGPYQYNFNGRFKLEFESLPDYVYFENGSYRCDMYDYKEYKTGGLSSDYYAPFYVVNGVMHVYSLDAYSTDPNKLGGKNATLRGFEAKAYAPGRDLYLGANSKLYTCWYYTKNLKQVSGIHRWYHDSGYSYSGYNFTINGCTVWPHGDLTEDGYNF